MTTPEAATGRRTPEAGERLATHQRLDGLQARLALYSIVGENALRTNLPQQMPNSTEATQALQMENVPYDRVDAASNRERLRYWGARTEATFNDQYAVWEQNVLNNMQQQTELLGLLGVQVSVDGVQSLYDRYIYQRASQAGERGTVHSAQDFVDDLLNRLSPEELQDHIGGISLLAKQLYGNKHAGEIVAQLTDLRNRVRTEEGQREVRSIFANPQRYNENISPREAELAAALVPQTPAEEPEAEVPQAADENPSPLSIEEAIQLLDRNNVLLSEVQTFTQTLLRADPQTLSVDQLQEARGNAIMVYYQVEVNTRAVTNSLDSIPDNDTRDRLQLLLTAQLDRLQQIITDLKTRISEVESRDQAEPAE